MERMTDYKPKEWQDLEELYRKQNVRINELEEENKKLKEMCGKLGEMNGKLGEWVNNLEEENKKLKVAGKMWRDECNQLREENKKLREFKTKREESMFYFKAQMERAEPKTASEAEDLQKAKKLFEKLYREELSCLEEENKKLKSDLSECKCSFGFESDEVGFWKREYKRLKKWIKDHCKGYGNLFPEDEMKRQWKKADKKRK